VSYKVNINFNKVVELLNSAKFSIARDMLLADESNYFNDSIFYNLLGFTELQLGLLDSAEKSYQRSIKIDSNHKDSRSNLGIVFYKKGLLKEAKKTFIGLLDQDNKDFSAIYNLGIILLDEKNYEEAISYFHKAIKINPSSYECHHYLGKAYEDKKNFNEAIKYYEIANVLNVKKLAYTYNNLGNVYESLKNYKKAIECYDEALNLNGDKSLVYNNLALLYEHTGDLDKSLSLWQKGSLADNNNLIIKMRYIFHSLYGFNSIEFDKEQIADYGDSVKRVSLFNKKNFNFDKNLKSKLNIGFVSSDFQKHPVGLFILDLFKCLKNKDLNLYAYLNKHINKEDEYSSLIKKNLDKYYNIDSLKDSETIDLIIKDKIDILIDMNGITSGNKLTIFANKPAPIQVTWAGFLHSTGLKEIDYIIGDPYVTPLENKNHFVEKIWQLPKIWCHLSSSDIKNINTESTPALKNNYITFGSFNNLHKMNDLVISTWSKILNLVPNSVLFIKTGQLESYLFKNKIIKQFLKNGVFQNRLILDESSKREDLLYSYNKVDIALDPFPYNGGTTSFETAWMCVPLLTIEGEKFISRCGLSINKNLGLEDWIAKNPEDYINKAVMFSKDFLKLDLIRSQLRNNSRKSILFNSEEFSNNLADSFKEMWTLYVNK
jgi:predicted O-linked N-acetylglucosamine transferase (SPINDLY family)